MKCWFSTIINKQHSVAIGKESAFNSTYAWKRLGAEKQPRPVKSQINSLAFSPRKNHSLLLHRPSIRQYIHSHDYDASYSMTTLSRTAIRLYQLDGTGWHYGWFLGLTVGPIHRRYTSAECNGNDHSNPNSPLKHVMFFRRHSLLSREVSQEALTSSLRDQDHAAMPRPARVLLRRRATCPQ